MAKQEINPNVELPSVDEQPSVAEILKRLNGLEADRAYFAHEREEIERAFGLSAKVPDESLGARVLAAGGSIEEARELAAKLAELRRREGVIGEAAEIVAKQLKVEREKASRALAAEVKRDVFLPAARVAASAWLRVVGELEKFRRLVNRVQDTGLQTGAYSPFNYRSPVSAYDAHALSSFINDLIRDGFIEKRQVDGVLPNLDRVVSGSYHGR